MLQKSAFSALKIRRTESKIFRKKEKTHNEYGGQRHNFFIRKSEDPMPRDAEKIVDLGYQELQKRTKNVLIPYKKSKKTPLPEQQKQHNKVVASERMVIEHVFSKLKIFNILSSVYRNFQKNSHALQHNLCYL